MADKQKRVQKMRDRLTEKSNRVEQKGIEAGAKGNYKKRNRKFDRADKIDEKRGVKTKRLTSAMEMKKQYKVKDINNNGKIDGWEQGKYNAINSATKMKKNYSMQMGSKEINSPTNFSSKSAMMMSKSPMMNIEPIGSSIKSSSNLRYSDGSVKGDSYGLSTQYGGNLSSLKADVSGLGSQKSDYTKGYLKGMEYGQNKKKIDRKAKKEEKAGNRAANRAARIENRLAKTQKKGEKATKAGKLQKARRLQKRKQRLLKRQK